MRLRREPAGAASLGGTWPGAGRAARPRRRPRGPPQRAPQGRRGGGRASGAGCRRRCRSGSARTCSGRRRRGLSRFGSPRAHLRPPTTPRLLSGAVPPGAPRPGPPRGVRRSPPRGAARLPARTSPSCAGTAYQWFQKKTKINTIVMCGTHGCQRSGCLQGSRSWDVHVLLSFKQFYEKMIKLGRKKNI